MADVKSTQVAALDAEPTQVLQTGVLGGRQRIAQFEVDLTAAGSGDSVYLIDLPVNATVRTIDIFQDGADTATFDIGDSNDQDGVIDGQAINQTLSVKAGGNNSTGTNGMSPADFQKQLWEILGYASRVAAGRRIRLTAVPGSAPGGNRLFGSITYVVD